MPIDAETLAVLAGDMMTELKGIRRAVERLARTDRVLSRADLALLDRLLPAVTGAIGSDWFLSRDLLQHHNAGLRLVLAGVNAKRLGNLLRRADGISIGAYQVERGPRELNSTLWRVLVSAVSNLHKSPRADRDVV
jgi:hypothetical protein